MNKEILATICHRFGLIINATKQGDAAILNGKWRVQKSTFTNVISCKKENKPSPQMKLITGYYVPTSDGKDRKYLDARRHI